MLEKFLSFLTFRVLVSHFSCWRHCSLLALNSTSYRLPIVYVYTVVPRVCKHGLPLYIKTSLEQAIFSQYDSDVILASNFVDCKNIGDSVKDLTKLIKIDTTEIVSNRTLTFLK